MSEEPGPARGHVEHVNGHRFEVGEIVCSRCGMLVEDAHDGNPCVASTVTVIRAEVEE